MPAAEVDAEAAAEAARTDPTLVLIAGYSPSGLGQLDTRCATDRSSARSMVFPLTRIVILVPLS